MENPAELLQLLINFDLLQEAAALALEYLNAVMGRGKEYFGIEVLTYQFFFSFFFTNFMSLIQFKIPQKNSMCRTLRACIEVQISAVLNRKRPTIKCNHCNRLVAFCFWRVNFPGKMKRITMRSTHS